MNRKNTKHALTIETDLTTQGWNRRNLENGITWYEFTREWLNSQLISEKIEIRNKKIEQLLNEK